MVLFSVASALLISFSTADYIAGQDSKKAKRAVIGLNVAAIVLSLFNAVFIALQDSFQFKQRAAAYLKADKDFDEAYNKLVLAQAKDDMTIDIDVQGKDGKEGNKDFIVAVEAFIASFSKIAKAANVGNAIGLVDSKDWVIEELSSELSKLKEEMVQSEQREKDKLELEKKAEQQKSGGSWGRS